VKLSKKRKKELEWLLAGGYLLEAAERYREMTGASSEEASEAIHQLSAGAPSTTASSSPARLDPAAKERAENAAMIAIARDQIPDAIVRYRRHGKVSLSEASKAVEALALAHRSNGRINPRLAETLIAMLAADHQEGAVTQLVTGAGYDEAEAEKFVGTLGRFAPAPPPGQRQLVRIAAAVGLLIAFTIILLLTGQL
jgi:ribosomal protein L7/L12